MVLYVADTNNHRIREIRNGMVSTLAGHKGLAPAPGYRDGTAIEARFDHPSGVATDEKGTTFVADTYNHLIRRIETDGTVTTAAGNTTHLPLTVTSTTILLDVHHHVSMEFQVIGMALYTMQEFYFPRDVAIGLNSTVLITDGHRVRRITTEGYSLVQNVFVFKSCVYDRRSASTGKQDGSGPLASFNNPRGIHDSPRDYLCGRLCRVKTSKNWTVLQLAPKLNCLTSAFNLKRPSGCASYDPPEDAFFLKGTPTAGNIYYNLGMYLTTNDMVSADAGGEPVGKRIMNCQGPKPPDFGPTSSGKTIFHDGGTGYYRDNDTNAMSYAMEESGFNTQFIVNCPPSCANSAGTVVGNVHYADFSSVCRSVHDGQVDDETGGNIAINTIGEKATFPSITRNGIASTLRSLPWPSTFQTFRLPEARVVVESVAGLPGAILDDVRGYKDGRPPTETNSMAIDVTSIPGNHYLMKPIVS